MYYTTTHKGRVGALCIPVDFIACSTVYNERSTSVFRCLVLLCLGKDLPTASGIAVVVRIFVALVALLVGRVDNRLATARTTG
jgi:hypothetical protein